MRGAKPSHAQVVQVLECTARLLEALDAKVHRLCACHDRAEFLPVAIVSLGGLVRRGEKRALFEMPGIGGR